MTTVFNTQPYCNCQLTGQWKAHDGWSHSFTTVPNPDGSTRTIEIWIHNRCRKPSKMNYERYVLGMKQIPQTSKHGDIYEIERSREFRKIIEEELEWEKIDEDEYDY